MTKKDPPHRNESIDDRDSDDEQDIGDDSSLEQDGMQRVLGPVLILFILVVGLAVGSVPFLILYTVFQTIRQAQGM